MTNTLLDEIAWASFYSIANRIIILLRKWQILTIYTDFLAVLEEVYLLLINILTMLIKDCWTWAIYVVVYILLWIISVCKFKWTRDNSVEWNLNCFYNSHLVLAYKLYKSYVLQRHASIVTIWACIGRKWCHCRWTIIKISWTIDNNV